MLPKDVVNALVEKYFSAFLDDINYAGGDISGTTGDGLMAIFQELGQPIALHMGLNSGLALVGTTRYEGRRGTRWTFTADGPVINLAARLADIAEAGQIIVGPETARRVAGRCSLQKLGRERLKNIAEPIDIHCVVRHRG